MTGQQLQQTKSNDIKPMQAFDEEPLNEDDEESDMHIDSEQISRFSQSQ